MSRVEVLNLHLPGKYQYCDPRCVNASKDAID